MASAPWKDRRLLVVLAISVGVPSIWVSAAGAQKPASASTAGTYYVSASGSDSKDGLTPRTAWRTLQKVEGFALQPGNTVLFRGGDSWGGAALKLSTNGASGSPITVASYGSGQARFTGGIYLNANQWLRFQNLDVSNATTAIQGGRCVLSSASAASTDIGFDSLTIHDCAGDGVNSSNAGDARFTLGNSSIANSQGNGIYFMGSAFTIANDSISNTGLGGNGACATACHGIYAKGPAATIVGNTITGFQTSAISLRFDNSDVEGNTIDAGSRGQRGISYYEETGNPGTTTISNNTISADTSPSFIQGIAIDYSPSADGFRPGGGSDSTVASYAESFVIQGNSISMGAVVTGQAQAAVYAKKVPAITISGNTLNGAQAFNTTSASGTYYYALYLYTNATGYSEHDNHVHTGAATWGSVCWNGARQAWSVGTPNYAASSGQGAGDTLF